MGTWVTVEEVKGHLGIAPYDQVDETHLGLCVEAVEAWVARVRTDLDPTAPLPGSEHLGAVMLAARWYRRRNSDSNSSFQEFGSPTPSIDRDVEHLLRVGRGQGPVAV